jgi:DNA-binding NtrC family response regulator
MIPMLEFERDGQTRFRVRLSRSETQVGRGERCDVTLPEDHVSRVHFVIRREGEHFTLLDRSRNGTLVNGVRVEQGTLHPGDTIEIPPWHIGFVQRPAEDPPSTVVRDLVSPLPVVSTSPRSGRVMVETGELCVREGLASGERYVIRKPEVRVGSDPTCDWVLPGDVAPHHFTVRLDSGGFVLRDGGSTEGTYVDGATVTGEVPLDEGARVQAGEALVELLHATAEDPIRPMEGDRLGDLVGRSEPMRKLFNLIRRVAPHSVPVLIMGESGTGKELVARALHEHSARASGPFVAVNCGAISRDLVESELFGHVKGAFTGATSNRAGAFREADGGTLFLDEIGDLALESQVRFLRVLETSQVRPVGADREQDVDVRIVAATHRNLPAEVDRGTFREDLYFRLGVMAVLVPPLRARPDDIPLLAQHFIDTMVDRPLRLTDDALDRLGGHPWRGNVRALRNCLLRAALLAEGEAIEATDIHFDAVPMTGPDPLMALHQDEVAGLLEQVERDTIHRAMETCHDKKAAAAKMLGIAKSTLHAKLKKYGLD